MNGIAPGSSTVHSGQVTAHVQCTFLLKREGRRGCRAMPACPQARRGRAAGNFLWEAWYRTTLISSTPFEAHRLEPNAGEIEAASISELHPGKKARNAQHGWERWLLTPCDTTENKKKCGPFHWFYLNKIKRNRVTR